MEVLSMRRKKKGDEWKTSVSFELDEKEIWI